MTIETDLLSAIRSSPEYDAPRLQYAEWLAANGQYARGRLIRVQCQLARMRDSDPAFDALQEEERDLLSENESVWKDQLGTDLLYIIFVRGFVERLRLNSSEIGRRLASLTASPLVSIINDLNIRDTDTDDEAIESLLAAPGVECLRSLDLSSTRVTHSSGTLLAQCTRLSQLKELDLHDTKFGDSGLAALASSPTLSNLEKLTLREAQLSDVGVAALGQSPSIRLVELDLRHNQIGDSGLRQFVQGGGLTRLQTLLLGKNVVGAEGLRAIFESPQCVLTELRVNWNPIGDEGVRAIALASSASSLLKLDLQMVGLHETGAIALSESPYLSQLEELLIYDEDISSAGQIAIIQSQGLSLLKNLGLWLSDQAAWVMSNPANLPHLEDFDWRASDLSAEAWKALQHRFEPEKNTGDDDE
jgi:uncharacterized protein (TIGR02996 family)